MKRDCRIHRIASGKQAEAFIHNKEGERCLWKQNSCQQDESREEQRRQKEKNMKQRSCRFPTTPTQHVHPPCHCPPDTAKLNPANTTGKSTPCMASSHPDTWVLFSSGETHFSFRDCLSFVVLPCLFETEFGVDIQQVGR